MAIAIDRHRFSHLSHVRFAGSSPPFPRRDAWTPTSDPRPPGGYGVRTTQRSRPRVPGSPTAPPTFPTVALAGRRRAMRAGRQRMGTVSARTGRVLPRAQSRSQRSPAADPAGCAHRSSQQAPADRPVHRQPDRARRWEDWAEGLQPGGLGLPPDAELGATTRSRNTRSGLESKARPDPSVHAASRPLLPAWPEGGPLRTA
jgi:hypothetical protein